MKGGDVDMLLIIGVVSWIVLGLVTFIWNAKRTHLRYFDKIEFIIDIVFSPVAFFVLVCNVVYEKFCEFMEDLLKKKINK